VRRGLREIVAVVVLLAGGCADAPEPAPPREAAPPPERVKTFEEEAAGDGPSIASDDPPFDPARLDDLSKHGKLGDALRALDKVLADPESGGTIVRAGGPEESVWTSSRELARKRLLALPAVREEAARAHEAEADERFERAWRAGSADTLVRLADRYPAAPSAVRALDRAASLYLESGALVAARHAWSRALETASPDERAALTARLETARRFTPPKPETAPARPLILSWHRKGGAPHSCAGDEALFLNDATSVSALEVTTGRLLWRRTFPKAEPGPISVEEEQVVAVRARRVLVLGRSSGAVVLDVELGRDLKGSGRDTIDGAASCGGLLVVAARLDGERVIAGFDLGRAPLFVTTLWEGKGRQVALLVERDRVHVAADGAIASLGRDGTVLWLRGLAAAAPSSRTDSLVEPRLERAGDELLFTGPMGAAVFGAETGLARSALEVPPGGLVLGARGAEPIVLEISDPMPPSGVRMSPDEDDERQRVVTISALHRAKLRPLGSLARECLCVGPPYAGLVASGVLLLQGDGKLRAIDLATWRLLDEVVCRGCRPVHTAGSVVLVAGTDAIDAYAATRPTPPRPLPAAAGDLLARLDSPSALERDMAFERLAALSARVHDELVAAHDDPRSSAEVVLATERLLHLEATSAEATARPRLEERFATLMELAGSTSDVGALVHLLGEGKEDEARAFLGSKATLASELGAYILDEAPGDVKLAAAELLVMAGGAAAETPASAVLERGSATRGSRSARPSTARSSTGAGLKAATSPSRSSRSRGSPRTTTPSARSASSSRRRGTPTPRTAPTCSSGSSRSGSGSRPRTTSDRARALSSLYAERQGEGSCGSPCSRRASPSPSSPRRRERVTSSRPSSCLSRGRSGRPRSDPTGRSTSSRGPSSGTASGRTSRGSTRSSPGTSRRTRKRASSRGSRRAPSRWRSWATSSSSPAGWKGSRSWTSSPRP
jgi:hypothetical protein